MTEQEARPNPHLIGTVVNVDLTVPDLLYGDVPE